MPLLLPYFSSVPDKKTSRKERVEEQEQEGEKKIKKSNKRRWCKRTMFIKNGR